MMKRREFIGGAFAAAALPSVVRGQRIDPVRQVAILVAEQ
jgi:hypothetical protein